MVVDIVTVTTTQRQRRNSKITTSHSPLSFASYPRLDKISNVSRLSIQLNSIESLYRIPLSTPISQATHNPRTPKITMKLNPRIPSILTILAIPTPIFSMVIPAPIPLPLTLPLPVPISAAPHPHPYDDPHWDFDLYNNNHCAGPVSKMEGWGSSGCRTDVPVGGAKAYILKDLDSSCSVTLYKDQRCSSRHDIGLIGHRDVQGCHSIGGKKRYARSFEVKCH